MSINKIKDNYNNKRAFTTRPDRAIEMGGFEPSATKNGSTFQMASGGTSTDFGDLIDNRTLAGGMTASSATRCLFYGGEEPGANVTDIDSMQLASTGNASDHGDLTVARGYAAATSNGTRAICAGGTAGPVVNTIDFGSIAQTGNFTDFGDLTVSRNAVVGICSPVRGVFAGGTDGTSPSPSYQNVIDYITINSTGNATDFGDLSGTSGYMSATNDSSGKAFFIGGAYGGDSTKDNETTDVITIATTGNASEFGELTQMTRNSASVCQGTTGFTMGGANPSYNNVIQRFVMPSLGNMTDFGDLNASKGDNKGGCGSHDGIDWGSVAVQRPSVTYMPGSGRALFAGGLGSPANVNTIDQISIPTLGNASDFGDLTATKDGPRAVGDYTKFINMGGNEHPAAFDVIESVFYASRGNCADFGNLTQARGQGSSAASTTRGVHAGGKITSPSTTLYDIIDYITMASAGNAIDFGDLTAGQSEVSNGIISSPTRGIFAGGANPAGSRVNIVEYITIASTGDATDFGDLTSVRQNVAGISNSTRGISSGGNTTNPGSNVIEYVTIASTGNFVDFGDLTTASDAPAGASTSTRGVTAGGQAPSVLNVIGYITIASTGNAADFGDLSVARAFASGCSDIHGGLQA